MSLDSAPDLPQNIKSMPPSCRLCEGPPIPFFIDPLTDHHYWHCQNCDLHFLDPSHYLTPERERARYELHQNSREDLGYVKFLKGFADWMQPSLQSNERGLDFGSGPGPVLTEILIERGYRMRNYDPFFAKNEEVFSLSFDFIVMSEVIEHLRSPRIELERLRKTLEPGGRLFVMTSLFDECRSFSDWSYRRDPTHIAFYSTKTMAWIAQTLGFNFVRIGSPKWILLAT